MSGLGGAGMLVFTVDRTVSVAWVCGAVALALVSSVYRSCGISTCCLAFTILAVVVVQVEWLQWH